MHNYLMIFMYILLLGRLVLLLGFISEKNEYFWGKRNRLTSDPFDYVYLYCTKQCQRSKQHYRVGVKCILTGSKLLQFSKTLHQMTWY